MEYINVSEAKAKLPKLVQKALKGERVVICNRGEPAVELTVYKPKKKRVSGLYRGQVWVADDFDEIDQTIIDAFEGNEPTGD